MQKSHFIPHLEWIYFQFAYMGLTMMLGLWGKHWKRPIIFMTLRSGTNEMSLGEINPFKTSIDLLVSNKCKKFSLFAIGYFPSSYDTLKNVCAN